MGRANHAGRPYTDQCTAKMAPQDSFCSKKCTSRYFSESSLNEVYNVVANRKRQEIKYNSKKGKMAGKMVSAVYVKRFMWQCLLEAVAKSLGCIQKKKYYDPGLD